jgi:GTPase SAR1 family protein
MKVLIVGDVGTGKTALTRRILTEAVHIGFKRDITVIDMAPGATVINGLPVGGKLLSSSDFNVRLLEAKDIKTPRLSAHDHEELLRLADHNRDEVEKLMDKFVAEPTKILFINDVSIYLQRGDLERLWGALEKADTVVVNGYLGEKLRSDLGTGISERERRLMEGLAARMDIVISL